jgi:deoxyribonuclease-4
MTVNGSTHVRTNRIGRHLGASRGLKGTLETAISLGCETIQLFVSNPQGWVEAAVRPDGEVFAEGCREAGIGPVVAHAKYLINLASTDPEQRERSIHALAWEMVAAGSVGAELVVVHSGSHGGDGEEAGMSRLVDGLGRTRELASTLTDGPVAEAVVENSVGAGMQLCSTFESLTEVTARAEARACVDTAHGFVAGYDLSTPDGAREVGRHLAETMDGRIALVHLNDARNELGSHRDGHRRIGEGNVPESSWGPFFEALPGVPVVMETPYGTPEVDAEQIRLVKELVGGSSGDGLPNRSPRG